MRQWLDVGQTATDQAEREAALMPLASETAEPEAEIDVAAACRLLGHRRLAVREAAIMALVEVGEPAVGAVAPFVQAKRIVAVEAAARVLLEIGTSAAIAALLDATISGSRRMQRQMRLWHAVMLAFGCVVWLVWAASRFGHAFGAVRRFGTGYAVCVQVIAAILNGHYNSYARRLGKVWSNATVQRISDGRMTALMSELALSAGPMEAVTREGLPARLATVTPADAGHFTDAARTGLLRALKGEDQVLVRAVLAAFGSIAEERELRAVRELAESHDNRRVRALIREALPAIEARVAETTRHGTLVRPASAPDADLLVCPAGLGVVETDRLVRPAEAPEGPATPNTD